MSATGRPARPATLAEILDHIKTTHHWTRDVGTGEFVCAGCGDPHPCETFRSACGDPNWPDGLPAQRHRRISDQRLRLGRLHLYVEPRDAWIGVYVDPKALYVCPLPFCVIRWRR